MPGVDAAEGAAKATFSSGHLPELGDRHEQGEPGRLQRRASGQRLAAPRSGSSWTAATRAVPAQRHHVDEGGFGWTLLAETAWWPSIAPPMSAGRGTSPCASTTPFSGWTVGPITTYLAGAWSGMRVDINTTLIYEHRWLPRAAKNKRWDLIGDKLLPAYANATSRFIPLA